MSGLVLLFLLCFWVFLAYKIAKLSTSKIKSRKAKSIVMLVVFIIIFVAPVSDDIVGGFQFRALCVPENMLIYDPEKVRNKTVKYTNLKRRDINKVIPIRENTREVIDASTGEVLITYKTYYAKGGWLSRAIGFPEGSPPYTFNGRCKLKEYYQLFDELNITKK